MTQTAQWVRQIAADQAVALGGLVPPALRATYVDRLVELHGLGYLGMTAIYRQLVNELALDGGHRRLHPRRMTTDFERRLASRPAPAHAMERPATADQGPGARHGPPGTPPSTGRTGFPCSRTP